MADARPQQHSSAVLAPFERPQRLQATAYSYASMDATFLPMSAQLIRKPPADQAPSILLAFIAARMSSRSSAVLPLTFLE